MVGSSAFLHESFKPGLKQMVGKTLQEFSGKMTLGSFRECFVTLPLSWAQKYCFFHHYCGWCSLPSLLNAKCVVALPSY